MHQPHPIPGSLGRDLEHGRGVGLIDADLGDFQFGRADAFQ